MNEANADLGGAPNAWNDPRDLAEHIRTLVQHGGDPEPHLGRLRELISRSPADLKRRQMEAFLTLVETYLAALAKGAFSAQDLKHAIEQAPVGGIPVGA